MNDSYTLTRSPASRMVRAQGAGLPVCLTVTHHDAVGWPGPASTIR